MLLQTENRAIMKNDRKHVAFHTIKSLAHKHHSLRMAAMAAMIQTATEGHFDVVITSVDKMLEDLQHEMDTLQGLLDRLDAKKRETQADITQTETDIAATEDAMAEALSNRNSENEDAMAEALSNRN